MESHTGHSGKMMFTMTDCIEYYLGSGNFLYSPVYTLTPRLPDYGIYGKHHPVCMSNTTFHKFCMGKIQKIPIPRSLVG